MDTEVVYLDRDNMIDLQLNADGSAVDLSGVTKWLLTFDGSMSVNSVSSPSVFDETYAVSGIISLKLGGQNLSTGLHDMRVVVYDAVYTSGLVWGVVPVLIR